MPRPAECNCVPCRRRRAAQKRWLDSHPVTKQRRYTESKLYKRQSRANESGVSDGDLDRKALENWPAKWGTR